MTLVRKGLIIPKMITIVRAIVVLASFFTACSLDTSGGTNPRVSEIDTLNAPQGERETVQALSIGCNSNAECTIAAIRITDPAVANCMASDGTCQVQGDGVGNPLSACFASVSLRCFGDTQSVGVEEDCTDGIDNDSDGDIDCADASCSSSSCDDGNACTAGDICFNGSCTGLTATTDHGLTGTICQPRVCNPTTGWSNGPPVANGTPCADANLCNGTETCQAGVCTDQADLNCDDGQFCNGTETCNSILGCQMAVPPVLSDGIPCTVDACNEVTDVITHTPNHAACDNGLYCDGEEICLPTIGCAIGAGVICAAGETACTTSHCDETIDSCVYEPVADGIVCDDGFICSTSSYCVAGDCVSNSPNNSLCDDTLPVNPAALDICVAGYTESLGSDATNHSAVDTRGCVRCYSASDPECVAVFGSLFTTEVCNNGIDDDLDTLVDCVDPNCSASPTCVVVPPPTWLTHPSGSGILCWAVNPSASGRTPFGMPVQATPVVPSAFQALCTTAGGQCVEDILCIVGTPNGSGGYNYGTTRKPFLTSQVITSYNDAAHTATFGNGTGFSSRTQICSAVPACAAP